MSKEFLVYWREEQIRSAISDGLLDHAASEQFGRVTPGDVMWICGKTKDEVLVTVGPLHVDDIVSHREAKRRLPYTPWPAKYHAFAAPEDATVSRVISLGPILLDLEFVSPVSRRLKINKPIGLQLQAMRQLSPASAVMIRQLWDGATRSATNTFEGIQRDLEFLGELDKERTVLERREQSFLRGYLFKNSPTDLCALCGEELPISLLIAAHIKPRSKCSESEKRDYANNVIPMCLLGCDALFERGLLIVENGRVQLRTRGNINARLKGILEAVDGRRTHAWKVGRVKYFEWHAAKAGRYEDSAF